MIREKYKWYISIISMGLAVILTTGGILNSTSNTVNTTGTLVAGRNLSTVLDSQTITDIDIDISESDWDWLIENATNEEYKSCNITINGETYYNVGIRPKGNTSLTNVASDDTTDRYSFKIKFDEYVDGQTYNGMESIVLNNMIQDSTYMKEYITYDLYSKLGVATPEMSYSDVKVNGETWGLYLAIEVLDQRYLENNFGTSEGNLYKPETMSVGGNKDGEDKGAGGNMPQMNGEKPMNFQHNMQNGDNGDTQVSSPDGAMQGGTESTDAAQQAPPNGEMQEAGTEGSEAQISQPNVDVQVGAQNGEMQATSQDSKAQTNNNFEHKGMNGGGGAGGGRPTEGADFIYIDDEVSSYSIVRDSAVFKSTTDEDFERVINMFKNLNDGTNLEEVLDVEEVLKYFAVNAYVINLDSYSGQMYHNYYLYENNGVCQILPWDLNLSFAGYGAQGGHGGDAENSSSTNMINFPIDNPVTGSLEDMPLIGKLLEIDEYKELYHSYLQQIADEYFNSGYYEDLVNQIDDLINEYVKEDPTAFCTYDEYTTAVSEMINFGVDRTNSVLAQLNGEQPSTTYGDIESTVNISALGDMGSGMNKGDKFNTDMNSPAGTDANNTSNEVNIPTNMTMNDNTNGTNNVPPDINNENTQNEQNMQMQTPPDNAVNTDGESANAETSVENVPDMQNHMNNQMVGGNINNTTQNNTKGYLILLGLIVLGLVGAIFANKFKRKRI